MTNSEKWDNYMRLIEQREQQQIKSSMVDVPQNLYEIRQHNVFRWDVTEVSYRNQLYKPGKITNKDIETIKNYYESTPDFDIEKVMIHLKCTEGMTTSTGCKFSEIGKRFYHKEDAERIANEAKIKHDHEEKLLANGHIRCERCRKVVEKSKSITKRIIFRGRDQKWDSRKNRYVSKAVVKTREGVFCSATCAAHEQMAMEG